jgi:hypothetical protein
VAAHGKEWKHIYSRLLQQFLERKIFPAVIEIEINRSLQSPAASSCAEDGLVRVLRKYNRANNGYKLVEEVPLHGIFRLEDGRIFKMGEKQRKRYKCIEVKTRKVYLFSPVYEVELVES